MTQNERDQAAEFLKHHGILKQKWGVRRGPPYPLTPEAKKSRGKRDFSNLSDDELRRVINRMQLERQLRDMTRTPKRRSKAKEIASRVLEKSVTDVATQATKYALGSAINAAAGKKIINLNEKKENKSNK